MRHRLIIIIGAIGILILTASQAAHAHGDQPGETSIDVEPLISETPTDLGGKRVTMLKVTYPPGVSFDAHRHPGTVLVYVASGEIRSQLGTDAEPVLYRAGDVWFEPPGARHVHSDNPSTSEPAVIIAVLVGDADAELVLPDE